MLLAWDFDGVLVDTLRECHASYNAALADENLPGLSLAEFSKERKTAVQATDFFTQYLLRRGKKKHTKENLADCYEQNEPLILQLREHYHKERDGLLEKMFDQNPVYPGVRLTLEALQNHGT
ncbi:MAG: HAD family hydrolase, partial [Candidatus Micrarchaeota archaeon]|nr:HAD family hydrolase [Candidatus Micrarchaeota archaeon]